MRVHVIAEIEVFGKPVPVNSLSIHRPVVVLPFLEPSHPAQHGLAELILSRK